LLYYLIRYFLSSSFFCYENVTKMKLFH